MNVEKENNYELKEVTGYMCPFCEEPLVYNTKSEAEVHANGCIMNPDNKTWATHKHLGVRIYPPREQFENKFREGALLYFIGLHNVPFNTETGEVIPDEAFYTPLSDEEYIPADKKKDGTSVNPVIEHSEEYTKFIKRQREIMEKAEELQSKEGSTIS